MERDAGSHSVDRIVELFFRLQAATPDYRYRNTKHPTIRLVLERRRKM
jgi:hypothetical protein